MKMSVQRRGPCREPKGRRCTRRRLIFRQGPGSVSQPRPGPARRFTWRGLPWEEKNRFRLNRSERETCPGAAGFVDETSVRRGFPGPLVHDWAAPGLALIRASMALAGFLASATGRGPLRRGSPGILEAGQTSLEVLPFEGIHDASKSVVSRRAAAREG